jgi:hypothetical protein
VIATASPWTGRATRRAPFFVTVLLMLVVGHLTNPATARGQDDAVPTWWHEAAGLTPLLTAPPPPNPATICLIDTGVTPTPDLDITARWAYDGGTLDDIRATEDSPGHGTLVAHFAAGAVNGWGGAGAFPHARISSVRVFPREGGASWQDYIRGITRCLKLDSATKVIVIPIGGQTIDPGEADELEAHIERVRDRFGVTVVAAAGNGGETSDFPARFDAAVAVAASARDGSLCRFSARGHDVDIAAPGCGVTQAGRDGQAWSLDGSSFAAPIVAAVLAAIRSFQPALTATEAERLLTMSARPGAPPLLDARAALAHVGIRGEHPESPATAVSKPGGAAFSAPTSPVPTTGAGRTGRQLLAKPRVRVLRRRGRVVLAVRNRPLAAVLELRIGGRRVRSRATRLRLRTRLRVARCRFASAFGASRWITVRW